ncbi:MAG: hypothetical protein Q8S84_05755 [bacterium]|nr:hypothetical protein [bacterium]
MSTIYHFQTDHKSIDTLLCKITLQSNNSIFSYQIFVSIIFFSIQYHIFSKKGKIVISKYHLEILETLLQRCKIEKSSQSI